MTASMTPLGAVGRGVIAGAVGTGAMTAFQTAVAKARDSEPSDTPAQVAKRIIEGVLQREVPDERMELLNNAMHWTYGTSWGALYGLVQGSVGGRFARAGLGFGVAVWGSSLVELPALGLAPPVWEYPPIELALDVSYHLAYGLATAAAFGVLVRNQGS